MANQLWLMTRIREKEEEEEVDYMQIITGFAHYRCPPLACNLYNAAIASARQQTIVLTGLPKSTGELEPRPQPSQSEIGCGADAQVWYK